MGVRNLHGIPPPPDSGAGGKDSAPVVRTYADAVQVWAAGHELAERYELRAAYLTDRARAAVLRRAAYLLRGL